MPIVVVANPKGGVGKSTLSTHIAGYYASRGRAVMLGDADRQQSSRWWLQQRPSTAKPIATWEVSPDHIARAPKGVTHVVLDTPGGLSGWRLKDALKMADRVIVPVQASVFDIFATRAFLDEVAKWQDTQNKPDRAHIALVGMRVDERTIAADKLREFVESLRFPTLTYLRPTQNYVHLAARGLTLFDLPPSRVAKDLAQWEPICKWLN